jgi:hypothetical protein
MALSASAMDVQSHEAEPAHPGAPNTVQDNIPNFLIQLFKHLVHIVLSMPRLKNSSSGQDHPWLLVSTAVGRPFASWMNISEICQGSPHSDLQNARHLVSQDMDNYVQSS